MASRISLGDQLPTPTMLIGLTTVNPWSTDTSDPPSPNSNGDYLPWNHDTSLGNSMGCATLREDHINVTSEKLPDIRLQPIYVQSQEPA
ncbi:hypothetical protein N7533_001475 [Penicillium manginii]|jgi:hypothetical protein|uniref:uncharacterized protein n=1 Tax=Penicillium manginii TaxID=203109 RepID=UPI0025475BE9|nr:uncharacterized protein N7533_001475 [Penicillium manginii]KAJ5762794.1 hypothetical protein N7533_001475 [Penicillium manginii]